MRETHELAKVYLPKVSTSLLNPDAYRWAIVASNQTRLAICASPSSQPPNPNEFLQMLTRVSIILLPEATSFGLCTARLHDTGLILALIGFPNMVRHTTANRFVTAARNEVVIFDPATKRAVTTVVAKPF